MRQFLLDTNVLSDLVRHPQGRVRDRIAAVGEDAVFTSIVVAAKLRYGATKKGSPALAERVELVLRATKVLALRPPVDSIYGKIRSDLEQRGAPIGGNDLLIAAQALALGLELVTDNEREFRRVPGLRVENWLRD